MHCSIHLNTEVEKKYLKIENIIIITLKRHCNKEKKEGSYLRVCVFVCECAYVKGTLCYCCLL